MAVAAVLGLLLTVLAGIAALPLAPWRHAGNSQERAPFYLAVSDLAARPMVRYTGSTPGTGTSWDIEVTSGGEQFGTLTTAGQQSEVLVVGGRTYVKPPLDQLSGLATGGLSAQDLQGRWLAGDDALTALLPKSLSSPAATADQLGTELGAATGFPGRDAAPAEVDGTPALGVALPDGMLYVSARAPYRVLHLATGPAANEPTTAPTTTPTPPATAPTTAPDTAAGAAAAAAWLRPPGLSGLDGQATTGGADVRALSPAQVDQGYGRLVQETGSLRDALDVGVSFDFNQTGNLSCNDSACVVVENVTTSTTGNRTATVTGSVTAAMSASVSVDGQPGGGCSQTQSLPINGGGTISCLDPDVAPLVSQIRAEKQAEAGGSNVNLPYTISFLVRVQIEAMATVQAQVDQAVSAEQAEQGAAERSAAAKPASYGGMLIDGQAQLHIIHGDKNGGVHKWPGQPGKSVFPPSWDTKKILDGVAEVATDPNSTWTWQTGKPGSMFTKAGTPSQVRIEGSVDGVPIRVIFEPATDHIITAFPPS